MAAFAWSGGGYVDLIVHPSRKDLQAEMIGWAEAGWREKGKAQAGLPATDPPRSRLTTRRSMSGPTKATKSAGRSSRNAATSATRRTSETTSGSWRGRGRRHYRYRCFRPAT